MAAGVLLLAAGAHDLQPTGLWLAVPAQLLQRLRSASARALRPPVVAMGLLAAQMLCMQSAGAAPGQLAA